MANNRNNFRESNFTFRFVPDFPPPPLPPPIFPPVRPYFPSHLNPQPTPQDNASMDQEFVKSFESRLHNPVAKFKVNTTSIIQIKEEMRALVTSLNTIDNHVKSIREKLDELSEEEWSNYMKEIEINKKTITDKLKQCTGSYLDMSRKLIAKRTSKRQRLKRQKGEMQLVKRERSKLAEERSRKIDENLQKIKDDIIKVQQEEQSKLDADVVLKEVLRKKHDAKKCVVKLDSLVKLRKARLNTARGRGEAVSETEADMFVKNIEKLKTLWNQKTLIYDKEEAQLRAKLADDAVDIASSHGTDGVVANLASWREFLFGDSTTNPQVDFQGDLHSFVAIRSQWDHYISNDGTPLPVGWIVPPLEP